MSFPDFRRRPPDAGRCLVMGIVNVTPDSFSDGGRYLDPGAASAHGLQLAAEGADFIDVGGESTRPGAVSPGPEEELRRVIPVVERLRRECDTLVSVDTSDPRVMQAAAAAGADLINDVRALRRPGAMDAALETGLPVCLMHMQGEPADMQKAPRYTDVVAEVAGFLASRAETCVQAGLKRTSLILDPGFGFGKNLEHNLALLRRLDAVTSLGFPVMTGLSRKSMIEQLHPVSGKDRLGGSVALAIAARARGARIVRVHDVAATVQAFRVLEAVEREA